MSAPCAHAVVVKKRDESRTHIVASSVGHAHRRLHIRSGAVSMGVDPPIQTRLRWTVGTPPRLLEVPPVEKHARMAERGPGGHRHGRGFAGTLASGLTHIVRGPLVRIWVAQRPIYGMLFRCSAWSWGSLRRQCSARRPPRRAGPSRIWCGCHSPHSLFNARAPRPRRIAQAGVARRSREKAALGFIAAKPDVRVPVSCGVRHGPNPCTPALPKEVNR